MAPGRRTQRQCNVASSPHSPANAAADTAPPSDSNNLGDNHTTSNELSKTKDSQLPGQETPVLKSWIWSGGGRMQVTQTYDPDTYDPDRPVPGTPEPEPYDPETYATWGRKHFGEEWYEQRKVMLQERNIYMICDPVYNKRQGALRTLERQIERRPLMPDANLDKVNDEGWDRLWARLSKHIPSIGTPPRTPSPPPHGSDSETDLSGYDTYDPTPSPREPTPIPEDPWERLEIDRVRWRWNTERYHFERIFLKESLIDSIRCEREDEDGDRQREREREEIRELRTRGWLEKDLDKQWRILWEYEYRQECFGLRARGLTQEEVDARQISRPPNLWDKDMWQKSGLTPQEVGVESGAASQPETSLPQEPKDISRKTRSGRVIKNTPARLKAGRRRGGSKHDVIKELDHGTRTEPQRRASRRLAGESPEFGLLPGRGETRAPLYEASSQQPSKTQKLSNSGPHRSGPSKKPTAAKGAKPQGISKPVQNATGRSRVSKRSRT